MASPTITISRAGVQYFEFTATDISDSDAHYVELPTDNTNKVFIHVTTNDGSGAEDVVTINVLASYEVGTDLTALTYVDVSDHVLDAASITNGSGAIDEVYGCHDSHGVHAFALRLKYQRTGGTADDADVTFRGVLVGVGN